MAQLVVALLDLTASHPEVYCKHGGRNRQGPAERSCVPKG